MSKESVVRARTSTSLKLQAENIFKKLGISPSEAIRLFYKQVTIYRGLPFDVRIPNKETLKAMKDADENRNLKTFKTKKAFFKDLGIS